MKKARVTISRPQSSHGSSCIAITIEDDTSHLHVLRLEMKLADFAACLTGHGFMPAKVDKWIGAKVAANVGKRLEVREVLLDGRAPYEGGPAWVRAHPDLKLDGWEIHDDGTRSQQNVRDKHRITLRRYVEAKPCA